MMKIDKIFRNLLIALCAIFLTSCNPNGLEHVFFSQADSEDVEQNSFDVVLLAPAPKWLCKVEQKEGETKTYTTTTWVEEGTIPAKTTIRILAHSYLYNGNKGSFLKSQYVVELPDGSRCIASLENQENKLFSDDLKLLKKKLPGYDRDGRHKTVKLKVIDSLIGKPLAEAEKLICPANQITVKGKGKEKEVIFSNVGIFNDSIIMDPLILKVENDIITANISIPEKITPPTNFFYKALTVFGKIRLYVPMLWENFPAWKKASLIGEKIGTPSYLARAFISTAISIFLFFIFYIFIAPACAVKSVTYIKPLGNGAILVLSWLVYLILCLASVIVWTPFSLVWFLLIFILVSISLEIEFTRCPHCHTTGKLRYIGEKFLGETESESEQKVQVKTDGGTTTHMDGSKTRRINVQNRIQWEKKRIKHYRYSFMCDACNQKVTYGRTEEDYKSGLR